MIEGYKQPEDLHANLEGKLAGSVSTNDTSNATIDSFMIKENPYGVIDIGGEDEIIVSFRANTTENSSNQTSTNTLRNFLAENAPEYIVMVPEYWLKQDEPIREVQISISMLFLIICLTGNTCQVLVMTAYARSRDLCTASNRLLISLLSADFLLLINCYISVYQSLEGTPVFSIYGCQIYGFNASVAALAEIWSLAAVSYDRLQAIFHPLETQKRITKKQAKVIIVFIWGIAVLFSIFPLLGWNKYVSEAYFMGCAFDMHSTSWMDRSYVMTLFVLCWFIPLLVILVAYIGIIYRVRHSYVINELPDNCSSVLLENCERSTRFQRDSEISRSTLTYSQRMAKEKILAKMVCLLLLVWILAWTPYVVMICWVMFFNAKGLSPNLGLIPTLCCKVSAGANAMLYGLRLPKFKSEVKRMLNANLPSCIVDHLSWLRIDSLNNSCRSVRHSDVYFPSSRRASRKLSEQYFKHLTPEYTSIGGHRRHSSLIIGVKKTSKIPPNQTKETHLCDGDILPISEEIRVGRSSFKRCRKKHHFPDFGKENTMYDVNPSISNHSTSLLSTHNTIISNSPANRVKNDHEFVPLFSYEVGNIPFIDSEGNEDSDLLIPKMQSPSVQSTRNTSTNFSLKPRSKELINPTANVSINRQANLRTNTSINIAIQSERLFDYYHEDEINIVKELTGVHNKNYKSVNFGEDVIKEMIMSSIFGVPMSAKTAKTAYRLMLQRVTIVATGFTEFSKLPPTVQECLLQHNADMVVSLRSAQFFQIKNHSRNQILCSLGVDDVETAKSIIAEIQMTYNTRKKDYKAVEYKNINTIKKEMNNSSEEEGYDLLLSRVGANVAFDENILILFSYVILFCTDFSDDTINSTTQKIIEEAKERLITLLKKYVYLTYPETTAKTVFKSVLECIQDLREFCSIKHKRKPKLMSIRKVKFTESFINVEPTTNTI